MRVDLYTNPHKEQREKLYHLAIQAGKIDFSNDNLFHKLVLEFDDLIADLQQHVHAEESFVHPFYFKISAQPLEEEHERLELSLQHMCHQMKTIQNEITLDKRGEQGLLFYRSFNRFISQYLEHIDSEERMLPFLWETYNDKELMMIMMTYQASAGSDAAMDTIVTDFPSMESILQQKLFHGFKRFAQTERFTMFYHLLQQHLPSEAFLKLKA